MTDTPTDPADHPHPADPIDPSGSIAPPPASSDAPPARTGKELFAATRPFATEVPARSWMAVVSTVIPAAAVLITAAVVPWWPVRLLASLIGGLILVRAFILYHDFMHGSLLRRSRAARPLFHAIGMVLLAPPRYWRYSHNFHHGNVGKPLKPGGDEQLLITSDLGSFPLMSTQTWAKASAMQRLRYRIQRHPLTLLFAYVTVFFLGLTVLPLLRNPRLYWDGAVAVLAHAAVLTGLWFLGGLPMLLFAFVIPYAIAAATGAYLFYAQHNYEQMRVLGPEEWTYYRGAVESSSYMRLSRLMDWFTGNIGYHHVHHLNPLIPFYRLPGAMAAIPELQGVGTTSLDPHEIVKCLRLNLWDPDRATLVPFNAAAA